MWKKDQPWRTLFLDCRSTIKDGIELFDSNIPPLIRPFDERLISLIHLHPDNNDNIALCDFYIKRFKNTCSLTDKVDSLNLQTLKDYFSLLLTSRGDKVEETLEPYSYLSLRANSGYSFEGW